jgi:formiminotetrahydrofolate cyclodeaminase
MQERNKNEYIILFGTSAVILLGDIDEDKNNIKINLNEIGYEDLRWTYKAREGIQYGLL